MPNILHAPWTEAQVEALNKYQQQGKFHPFTCGGHSCIRSEREDEGVLTASINGWVCPCGQYTQDWCHYFMTN